LLKLIWFILHLCFTCIFVYWSRGVTFICISRSRREVR